MGGLMASHYEFRKDLERTDALITADLAAKRALQERNTQLGAKTDVRVAQIGAQSRLLQGRESNRASLAQENIQQTGQSARQRLVQAGDFALQQLRGRQAEQSQSREQTNELTRISAAAEEARKTKEFSSGIGRKELENIIEYLSKKRKAGRYIPGEEGDMGGDQYSDFESSALGQAAKKYLDTL
jgi:hypothetical protein